MSDVRHYARAREHLENHMDPTRDSAATLNAQLAASVAVRELCGELRNSLQGINSRLRDVASALDTDANLVQVDDETFVSLNHVVAVFVDPVDPECCRVRLSDRGPDLQIINRQAPEIASKLGVSV